MAAVLLDGDDINVAFTLTTGTTMSEFSFYMTKLQAMLGSLIVSGFSATVQSAAFVCQWTSIQPFILVNKSMRDYFWVVTFGKV